MTVEREQDIAEIPPVADPLPHPQKQTGSIEPSESTELAQEPFQAQSPVGVATWTQADVSASAPSMQSDQRYVYRAGQGGLEKVVPNWTEVEDPLQAVDPSPFLWPAVEHVCARLAGMPLEVLE